ncbi:MAG TPA: NlpC/P60 family protein [Pyrinomonadaceae bacterium]|jgi:cell wall-associated NlpC family hydrolase|nr:NlpC/P60 family protein [Pyrinomonadaceae bacterium]
MDPREEELRRILSDVERRETRARKLAWLYVAVPLLVGILWISIAYLRVSKLKREEADLAQQITIAKAQLQALINPQGQSESFDTNRKQVILNSTDGRRRKALEEAFRLQEQSPPIPFKFGGKSPNEGLDTSGYVAHVLSQAGVITNPETYYSGRLLEQFAKDGDRGKDEIPGIQAGDLIFYDPTTPVFYLDKKYCLGMVPKGIYVMDRSTLEGLKLNTLARVPY